ncbi:MAG: pyroglutamyl-peptidase I [Candidatus Nanopelagicaceae bacterium]|nr:pyroglutamyl-peptidase I [Candidatus Nanopelagicaceae bacterium]
MERILLTGFEPFHNSSLNPSQEIIKRISHRSLVAKEVLPVTFGEASLKLISLIDQHKPTVVIALGQAEGRKEITPERIAINLDDARIPDNAGNSPKESKTVAGGPDAYFTTLPIKNLVEKLNENRIPASISLSAGTFVCNHIFYAMQHHCLDKSIKSGFIHLPLMNEQAIEFPELPTMQIEEMIRGIELVLDLIS